MHVSLQKLATSLRLRIKNKKVHCVLDFYQSKWLKSYIEFKTRKRIEAETNGNKNEKALCFIQCLIFGQLLFLK